MLVAASASPSSPSPFHLLEPLWPLWVLVALILLAKAARVAWIERRLRRAGIREIDEMDGPTFERRLARLFRDLGYRVEHVGAGGRDFGGDLLVSKGRERSIVQAKCWRKNVGVKAVQEVAAARGYYKAEQAVVITNRSFTEPARKLARANDVKLWGRDELVRRLLQARGADLVAAPGAPVAEPLGEAAFCARCGKPVSARVRAYCRLHRERFAGLVYCYEHQRSV